jgi:hypothetical protein
MGTQLQDGGAWFLQQSGLLIPPMFPFQAHGFRRDAVAASQPYC